MAAQDVGYAVEGRSLLAGVSLELRPGEVHAVLGRNGAGKSTLLRILAGELRAGSGTVRLNGRELAGWNAQQLARQRAVMPQSESLRFGFTVEQVVALGRFASLRQRPEEERRIVRQALELAGVGHLYDRKYPSLSGGERARVHFARAMAQIWPPEDLQAAPARYLLLDEPTASLDLAHQHDCLLQARCFAASGVGVLIVLHDPNLALRYADQATLLAGGRVAGQGPTRRLLDKAMLEQVYGLNVDLIEVPGEDAPVVVAHARRAGQASG
ncbi:MAG: heme ABC transporter ATP-binding protein [Nevskia sp.]|nr:heme ABC transporter ATP-binding protein [Nevskia sp.]